MRRAWLGLLAAVLSACSLVNDPSAHQGGTPDAGPTDAGAPPIAAAEVCSHYARVFCEGFFRCCGVAPERTDTNYMDCMMMTRTACRDSYQQYIDDPRTGYDPQTAGEVVAEGMAYVETCDPDILEWYVERSGFQRALRGTVAPGDVCTPTNTMLNENFDIGALFSCEGSERACVCQGGDVDCALGTPQWNCLTRAHDGGHCILYWDCEDGLRCDHSNISMPHCAARKPVGASCSDPSECESLACYMSQCQPRNRDNGFCHAMAP